MYKKAGIIVGSLLIVIAVAVFLIASSVQNGEKNAEQISQTATGSQVVTNVAQTQQPVQTVPQQVETQQTLNAVPVEATQPVQTQATTFYVAETTSFDISEFTTAETTAPAPVVDPSSLIELSPDTLPETLLREDAGTVVGKKVYAYNGQVLYSLVISTTTCGRIEFFTTYENYKALNEGTRVECNVLIYMAQSGNFPSISKIAVAQS